MRKIFSKVIAFVVLMLVLSNAGGILAQNPNKNSGRKSRDKTKRESVRVEVIGAVTGEPWTGDEGVRRTTEEIMREQAIESAKPTRGFRIIREREVDREKLIQNSESPAIERYPIDPLTEPVRTESFFAPQTVGLEFPVGTLADTLSFPPDTMGDVGPSQYIMAVNGRIRSFNKQTGAADGILNADMDVFFSSVRAGSPTTDPRIRYDRLTQRWFVMIINTTNVDNRVLIAVSNSAVITTSTVWTYFFFQHNTVTTTRPSGCFADYPTLGVDANALYIGVNQFCPSNYAGSDVFVVRKSSVLGSGPIVVTAFRNVATASAAGPYTPQGVDNFTPGATEGYFIGVDTLTFGTLYLRKISDPAGTPSISANIQITVPTTSLPINVPNLGGSVNLDGLDDRLFMAVLRNGRIWTVHNIQVNASGVASNSGGRNGSRWYEIGNLDTTPTLIQSGTWFDSSTSNPKSFWIPAIAVTGQGHVALAGSSAGSNDRINAATVGRLATDPLGTLQSTSIMTNVTTSYNPPGDTGNPRRWGDYSFASVDPDDDMTIWTIQQIANPSINNSYQLRVFKLLAPPPATPASASPSVIPAGQSSINVTINGTSVNGSGFFDPGPGFTKRLQASISGGVTINSVTYVNPTQVILNISTVGAVAGARNITITNPDGQSATGNNLINIMSAPIRTPYDFDGDGKSDISIFRPSEGAWYLDQSSQGFSTVQFGSSGDIVASGDFDGDGKADIAVFRPSQGTWYRLNSSNGQFVAVQFGQNGDIPTVGDFDGDGKADIAVFRPSQGTWYRLNSSNGQFVAVQFGQNGDIPTVGDFDGDGKADVAVFRPSQGTWYRLNSSNGSFFAKQFGISTDKPVPSVYIPPMN